jgi:alkylation response protein AidB-like acyl-CoA dehydrogenase
VQWEADNADDGLLREGARRALAEVSPADQLCRGLGPDRSGIEKAWSVAAGMGWTGVRIPSDQGGLGLGMAEAAILQEEMGRSLYPAPYGATAILAPALLSHATGEARDRALTEIAEGGVRVAMPGLAELSLPWRRRPSPRPGGNAIGLQQELVEYAEAATHALAICARPDGAALALFMPLRSVSVTIAAVEPLDPSCPIATLSVAAPMGADVIAWSLAEPDLADAAAIGYVAAAAELVGLASASFELAVSYAKERQQFGVPIGSFQAIKHRLVDGFVLLENARSATRYAAQAIDEVDAGRHTAADAARSAAIDAAIAVTAECVQIHGALGFSAEHRAHLYLKRARRLAATMGGAAAARRAIGDRLSALADGAVDDLFAAGPA